MFIDLEAHISGTLSRAIYIRNHGGGFAVTVEPHPLTDDETHGLNRRFDRLGSARAWANGTRSRKGWPVFDETDPGRGAEAGPEPARAHTATERELWAFVRGEFAEAQRKSRWGAVR